MRETNELKQNTTNGARDFDWPGSIEIESLLLGAGPVGGLPPNIG
jgi:hypothetical protein